LQNQMDMNYIYTRRVVHRCSIIIM